MTDGSASDPRAALEALYRSTRTDLLRYLVRRCQDADEAADLLAETYLTAWRKLEAIPTASGRSCGCSAWRATCCCAAPVRTGSLRRSWSGWPASCNPGDGRGR